MNPRYLPAIALLSAAAAVSTLFSCTDEMDAQFDKISNASTTGCDDGIIRFIDSEWRDTDRPVDSRSGYEDENAGLKHRQTIPMDGCENGDTLFLKIYEQESSTGYESRGSMLKTGKIHTEIGVTGYKFGADKEWSEEYTPDFMYNVKYTYGEDPALGRKSYNIPDSPLWPGANYNLKFFVISPYKANDDGKFSAEDYCGSPKFTYVVPVSLGDQKDILAGESGVINGNPSSPAVKINLEHILSTIQFRESEDFIKGNVRRITLKGLRGSGTYDYGTKTWEVNDDVTNYSQDIDKYFNGIDGEAIMDSTNCFFLIPQTIPEGASIEVQYSPWTSKDVCTLTAPLSGKLEKGKTYIFKLSTTSIDVNMNFGLTIPENLKMNTIYPKAITALNINNTFTYTINKGTNESIVSNPVVLTWQMKWYDYNSETVQYDKPLTGYPNWISGWCYTKNNSNFRSYTSLNNKGVTDVIDKIYLTANEKLFQNIGTLHDTKLQQSVIQKGTLSTPWNLSNNEGSSKVMNTANSYIVNAPGTYSIPLVYGNAVKNGSYNNDLKNGDTTGPITTTDNMLKPYPLAGCVDKNGDYKLVQVTESKHYIYDYAPEGVDAKEYITTAELIWQDAKGLISSLSFSEDHKSIIFTITPNNIQQGNALIGVKSGNYYLWAWHIWVTDYEPGVGDKTIRTRNGKEFTLMPYYLGWVDASKNYPGGKARMELSLTNYPEYSAETIVNMDPQTRVDGNMPYWMSQNPFPARTSRQHYKIDGTAFEPVSKTIVSKGDSFLGQLENILKNPGVINNSAYGISLVNIWSWKQTAKDNVIFENDKVVKSLYDPCPYGYCIPPSGLFDEFREESANSDDYYPQANDSGRYGLATLYCDPSNKIDTVEFPYTGLYEGSIFRYDYSLFATTYVSAGTSSSALTISHEKLANKSLSNTRFHTAVRPMREQ